MLRKSLEYIRDGIWEKKDHEYASGKVRWAVRQFKVLIFTASGFGRHGLAVRSAALTFYTLMSLVPIVALIFAIVKGFGLDTALTESLYDSYPQFSDLLDYVLKFAQNLLVRTRGGLVAGIGLVVLFWAVVKVFGNMESAFNHIWEVKKSRSITRKLSDYLSVIVIAPLLWAGSNTLSLRLRDGLQQLAGGLLVDVLYGLLSLVVLWVMFTFIYYVLPNTRVKFSPAFTAGVITGTFFQIFQVAYIYIQTEVSSYNAIYGSFAALPLFLLWLQTSWQILLLGGELSFAYQNINRFEQERSSLLVSHSRRRMILLASLLVVLRNFLRGGPAVTSELISEELGMPVRIVKDVLFDLQRAGIIAAVNGGANDRVHIYIPARDVSTLRLLDVIEAVEEWGEVDMDMGESAEMEALRSALGAIGREAGSSQANVPLADLLLDH